MHSLAEGLRKCSGLTSLTLTYNLVNDDRLTRYALRLQHYRRLLLVDFTGNNIFNGGAEALARSLEHHEALAELLLPHNNIGLRGAAALLEHSGRCSTLTSLDLSNNVIGRVSPTLVHPALPSFLRLRLPNAPLDFEAMLDRAAHATVLRRLLLADNHLLEPERRALQARWGAHPGLTLDSQP